MLTQRRVATAFAVLLLALAAWQFASGSILVGIACLLADISVSVRALVAEPAQPPQSRWRRDR